jgi:hypothetical protein
MCHLGAKMAREESWEKKRRALCKKVCCCKRQRAPALLPGAFCLCGAKIAQKNTEGLMAEPRSTETGG